MSKYDRTTFVIGATLHEQGKIKRQQGNVLRAVAIILFVSVVAGAILVKCVTS